MGVSSRADCPGPSPDVTRFPPSPLPVVYVGVHAPDSEGLGVENWRESAPFPHDPYSVPPPCLDKAFTPQKPLEG
jgi:hypothetical protein